LNRSLIIVMGMLSAFYNAPTILAAAEADRVLSDTG
jgi:hypothetical protein